jgi:hypothetical protein
LFGSLLEDNQFYPSVDQGPFSLSLSPPIFFCSFFVEGRFVMKFSNCFSFLPALAINNCFQEESEVRNCGDRELVDYTFYSFFSFSPLPCFPSIFSSFSFSFIQPLVVVCSGNNFAFAQTVIPLQDFQDPFSYTFGSLTLFFPDEFDIQLLNVTLFLSLFLTFFLFVDTYWVHFSLHKAYKNQTGKQEVDNLYCVILNFIGTPLEEGATKPASNMSGITFRLPEGYDGNEDSVVCCLAIVGSSTLFLLFGMFWLGGC